VRIKTAVMLLLLLLLLLLLCLKHWYKKELAVNPRRE